MNRTRQHRIVLASQILLILLPVLVLSVVGFYFLRQDKHLVQREAEERARELASAALTAARMGLTNYDHHFFEVVTNIWPEGEVFFQLGSNRSLVFPWPRMVMTDVFDPSRLSGQELELWSSAQKQEFQMHDLDAALAAWNEGLPKGVGTNFYDVAQLSRATLLQKLKRHREALVLFDGLLDSTVVLPSGVPVKEVAMVGVLEAWDKSGELKEWLVRSSRGPSGYPEVLWRVLGAARGLLSHPSPTTGEALRRVAERMSSEGSLFPELAQQTRALCQLYAQHETARELFAELSHLWEREFAKEDGLLSIAIPWAGKRWSCRVLDGTNVVCRSSEREIALVRDSVGKSGVRIPDFAELEIRMNGLQLFPTLRQVRSDKRHVLASVSYPEGSSFTAMVFLSKPEILYAQQRQRALWLGVLISVAFLMALGGIVHTVYSYRKQALLNEMKSNFVSSVSHELRAPLASMQLLSEGLQRERVKDGARQQEYYKFLVQECRRLAVLVENVLDFSRIEQGRKQYEFEEGDLRSVVRQAIQTISPAAAERGILLNFRTEPEEGKDSEGLFDAKVDAPALQRAVVNLLDNAVKHSPGKGTVEVRLRASQEEHGEMRQRRARGEKGFEISVSDSGSGIPESEHRRIFERFHRVGSELRRETQGVGIGLSIVKHIVEGHGGSVKVRSKPGQGSTFTIVLPRH